MIMTAGEASQRSNESRVNLEAVGKIKKTIEEVISKACREGAFEVKLALPACGNSVYDAMRREMVIEDLRLLGYNVGAEGDTLTLNWDLEDLKHDRPEKVIGNKGLAEMVQEVVDLAGEGRVQKALIELTERKYRR